MSTPRFSIIIPAYNAENYIRKALDSVASQTFKNYELIVICDSCTDQTEAIAKSYGAKTVPVNYHNDGLSRSRGLDEARGEWVLFIDDDDWWLHEYVLQQLDEKIKSIANRIDVLCFSFIFKGVKYATPRGNRGNHWIAVWNKCWRRWSIGNTRFPNVKMCSDKYFHKEMFSKGLSVADWDMPMYYYNYMRKGSQTSNDAEGIAESLPLPAAATPDPDTRYMIHTCPERLWYVEEYLIPSMTAQGIPQDHIKVWNDTKHKGILKATMTSWMELEDDGGTWHLQDDTIISNDFKQKTESFNYGIVCGFKSRYDGSLPSGVVNVKSRWFSFPCIRIPNKIAKDCADWVLTSIIGNPVYRDWWVEGRNDDLLFWKFVEQTHPNEKIVNLEPNIIDHIDYLIGGSLHSTREVPKVRSVLWEDEDLVTQLKKKLKGR